MHRAESDDLLTCAACGAALAGTDRVFSFGSEGSLCFACAEDRGGAYDATEDRWTRSPDLAGLWESED